MTSRSAIKGAGAGSRGAAGELEAEGAGAGRPGRRAAGASAMFYSGLLTEGGRKETDMREAASLRQQRRMKQAVQFIHKDSADLLPLDGLKKLGSSKDTVSAPPPATPALGLRAAAAPQASLPLSLSHPPGLSLPAPWGPRSFPRLLSLGAASSLPALSSEKKETLPYCPRISFCLSRISNLAPGAGASQQSLGSRGQFCVPDRGDSQWVIKKSGTRGFLTVAESI